MEGESSRHQLSQKLGLVLGIAFSLVFTGLIWFFGPWLDSVELRPDREIAFWYPWVSASPTIWTRLSVWGLYAAHQLTVWWLIWRAQSQATKYSNSLGRINVLALVANAVFIALHFLQTHVFYDGLAIDVPEQSSQWSVILSARDRAFDGKPAPRVVLWSEGQGQPDGGIGEGADGSTMATTFAWAIIYTFWYHPMVSTPGHLLGFLYMFLLMLQGSLFFTRIHVNKWWMVTQEALVLIHGTLVALNNAPDFWQMFCFGFAGLFVVTQMHGLGLSLPTRWAFLIAYVGGVALVFSRVGLRHLHQITWIPLTEYAVVFVIAAVVWATMKVLNAMQFRKARTQDIDDDL